MAAVIPVSAGAAIRDWLAIARPRHYLKNLLLLVGVLLAGWGDNFRWSVEFVSDLVWALVGTSLIASGNYVLNGMLDAPTDRNHPQKLLRPLVQGRIRPGAAGVFASTLWIVGLAMAAFLGQTYFLASVAFIASAVIYNVPPLRLKAIPFLDVQTEALNSPIRLLLGWQLVRPAGLPELSLLWAAWLAGAAAMAYKRLNERRQFACQTTAAAYRSSFSTYSSKILIASILIYAAAALVAAVFYIAQGRLPSSS